MLCYSIFVNACLSIWCLSFAFIDVLILIYEHEYRILDLKSYNLLIKKVGFFFQVNNIFNLNSGSWKSFRKISKKVLKLLIFFKCFVKIKVHFSQKCFFLYPITQNTHCKCLVTVCYNTYLLVVGVIIGSILGPTPRHN